LEPCRHPRFQRLTIMTKLAASGCQAEITCDGKKLPTYGVKVSKTAWGGDHVEAYVPSTSGARFQINIEATWAGYHRMIGKCHLNGKCKYYNLFSAKSLSSLGVTQLIPLSKTNWADSCGATNHKYLVDVGKMAHNPLRVSNTGQLEHFPRARHAGRIDGARMLPFRIEDILISDDPASCCVVRG
jgi:hypothetical protein